MMILPPKTVVKMGTSSVLIASKYITMPTAGGKNSRPIFESSRFAASSIKLSLTMPSCSKTKSSSMPNKGAGKLTPAKFSSQTLRY